MNRIKNSEVRTIDGRQVTINYIESMSYQGVWEGAGYSVLLDGKQIALFIGWPTDSDIRPNFPKA